MDGEIFTAIRSRSRNPQSRPIHPLEGISYQTASQTASHLRATSGLRSRRQEAVAAIGNQRMATVRPGKACGGGTIGGDMKKDGMPTMKTETDGMPTTVAIRSRGH